MTDTLAKVDKARIALDKAETIGEIKQINDLAEAAVEFAKKAKLGHEDQNRAAELALRAKRKAGAVLDSLKRGQGKRTDLTSCNDAQSSDYARVLAETGMCRKDVERWQEIADADQDGFESYIEHTRDCGGEITTAGFLRAKKSGDWAGILGSDSPEWYTPQEYVDAAREVMGGIDLDPASCELANQTVGATYIFTKTDDSLNQEWRGRVFLNPPYGADGPPFVGKLVDEFNVGHVSQAVILVNSRATDAGWFQPMFDGVICFTDHRIDFNSPDEKNTSSTHGSCFIYFGTNDNKFAEVFSEFGNVVKRWP